MPFGRLIFPLAIALALSWLVSRYLPTALEVAVGVGFVVLGVLTPRLTKLSRSRTSNSTALLPSGFLILSDHVPSDVRTIGLILVGIGLGIALALIPLRVTELRQQWQGWAISGFLLTATLASIAIGLEQLESNMSWPLACLWLLPGAISCLALLLMFVRTATASGIFPRANTSNAAGPVADQAELDEPDFMKALRSLPFMFVGVGLVWISLLLRPEIGSLALLLLLLIAFLAGVGLFAAGAWKTGWKAWLAPALCWSSAEVASRLLTTPWYQVATLSLSVGLLVAIALAVAGRGWSSTIIPARSWSEASFAFIFPLASVTALISLIF